MDVKKSCHTIISAKTETCLKWKYFLVPSGLVFPDFIAFVISMQNTNNSDNNKHYMFAMFVL